MKQKINLEIPITVELSSTVRSYADSLQVQALRYRLAFELGLLIQRLGLNGEPIVNVRDGDTSRAVRVIVNGVLQPFSPNLMHRAWMVAVLHHRLEPSDYYRLDSLHFPSDWLDVYLTQFISPSLDDKWSLVSDFLLCLVLAVIQKCPGSLLSSAQAEAFKGKGYGQNTLKELSWSPAELMGVLKTLLELGVSLTNHETVFSIASEGIARGQSAQDTAQYIFARLRTYPVEIHAHPKYLQAITGRQVQEPMPVLEDDLDESFREEFQLNSDSLIQMGIRIPHLLWVPALDLQQGMIAVKINDNLGVPTLGPSEELLSTPEKAFGILVDRVCEELLASANQILSVEDVEYELALLDEHFPELVQAAMARFSLVDITYVLQALLREGLSIRDLRGILERLLQYDVGRGDFTDQIVFDDRLILSEVIPEEQVNHWTSYLKFVRNGLRSYFSHMYAGDCSSLSVILVHPELEKRLVRAFDPQSNDWGVALTDAEQEAIRDAVWTELTSFDGATVKPAILTTGDARPVLRDIIAPEMPDIPVLANTELELGVSTQPLATISFPEIQTDIPGDTGS